MFDRVPPRRDARLCITTNNGNFPMTGEQAVRFNINNTKVY